MVISSLGTNHADEITLSPETHTHDILPLTAGNGAIPSPGNQPLSNDLIRRALDARPLLNTLDHGDLISIIPSDDGGNDVLCWFLIRGQNRKIFHLVCTFDVKIPRCDWGTALRVCNAFNDHEWFGRAILNIREGQDEAALIFDAAIDCTDGVSQQFLETLITTHLASAFQFYLMAREDEGLPLSHSKKASKPNRNKELRHKG